MRVLAPSETILAIPKEPRSQGTLAMFNKRTTESESAASLNEEKLSTSETYFYRSQKVGEGIGNRPVLGVLSE